MRHQLLIALASLCLAACSNVEPADVATNPTTEFQEATGVNCAAPYQVVCGSFVQVRGGWEFEPVAGHPLGLVLPQGATPDQADQIFGAIPEFSPNSVATERRAVCAKVDNARAHFASMKIAKNLSFCLTNQR